MSHCNAIAHNGAEPVFVDISESIRHVTRRFAGLVEENCEIDGEGFCRHFQTGKRVMACIPMHTFGHPLEIEDIADICQLWKPALIEDVAETVALKKAGILVIMVSWEHSVLTATKLLQQVAAACWCQTPRQLKRQSI